jgi:predicted ATPase
VLSGDGISEVRYEDTEHFSLTRDFLNNRERYFRELFPAPPPIETDPD